MSFRPFALERYFAQHEFSARYLLGSSDPEALSLGDLLALEPDSEAAMKNVWLGYTESLGSPALRTAIADQYDTVGPEQVITFTGAQEPLYAFMHAVLQAGDHLIVHTPCYQSHRSVAQDRGLAVSDWPGRPEDNWAPDLDALPGLLQPQTRAILVCSPQNPTGYLFDSERWQALVAFARHHGLWLFADEVYQGTEHDPATRLPSMVDAYERGISLGCLSKNAGLAGLRLGWIATRDSAVFARFATFKDFQTICASAPSEFLGHLALKHFPVLLERTRQRLRHNRSVLEAFLARHSEQVSGPLLHAGTTAFPAFHQGSAQAFCDALVTRTGVMLVPGTHFEWPGEFLRFGYGRQNFPEALGHLEAYLAGGA